MDYIPIQILEENDATRKLIAHHVYSIKDLQKFMNVKAEGGSGLSKEVEKILEDKIQNLSKAIKEGVDPPRNLKFVEKFHSMPGILITLNGINLITGKRGTGKTTLAFIQMLDAYLELNAKGITQYLLDDISERDFIVLSNLKILIFSLREIFYCVHFNGLLEEKAKKFIEKNMSGIDVNSNSLELYTKKFKEFMRLIIVLTPNLAFEEFKAALHQILRLTENPENADIFGIILDDISFLFNKIDSLSIKSDVRNFAKVCNQLIRQNNVPIIITDSVRSFYEEDSYEDLKIFTPAILFSSISDIFYLMRTDHNIFKLAQLKSSKDVIPAETKPH